jgi:hypothetical protein
MTISRSGMTATQNTAKAPTRQDQCYYSNGPTTNALTVSSDWRNPNAAPRRCSIGHQRRVVPPDALPTVNQAR